MILHNFIISVSLSNINNFKIIILFRKSKAKKIFPNQNCIHSQIYYAEMNMNKYDTCSKINLPSFKDQP